VPAYPDQPNADLLDRVPLTARIVLDVGCGTGSLGAAYRRLNPRALLLGIELDGDAAAIAAHRLDQVAAVDVERDRLPFELPHGIDCLIYGDVIEHLRDPGAVLRAQVEALSADGTVLICVPNIEHWSFVARLLRGDWTYEPTGLFDETHLRWFSLESMRQMLLEAGLALCDVHPRIFDAEQARGFVRVMEPALRAMGIDPQSYVNRAMPLQYVWRARKREVSRLMVAGTMLEPVDGVSHVRVVYPLQAMATDAAMQTQLLALNRLPDLGRDVPKVLVLHRPVLNGGEALAMTRGLMDRGWIIVTEFDDHPDFFRALQDPAQLTFRSVHAVQTSTEVLASILRQRNPEVRVFPNAVRELPDVVNFADPDRVTVFFGALNRAADWGPLVGAINEVAAEMGERLRFEVVHDQAFFDALTTPHKRFTPTCEHDSYLRLLGRSEICFMPLSDTPFNRAKSDLKFIEAAACRVATLASDVVYGETVRDGQTGLIFRNEDELRTLLTRLVTIPDVARDIGDAAREYVARERMLAYQTGPRIAWYRSLWERRAELNEAVRSRVAGREMMAEAALG
jgi:SAM-dependent methyltransferase